MHNEDSWDYTFNNDGKAALKTSVNCLIMDAGPPDVIQVSRKELESEHNHLVARIQQLRRLLGFPPLPTGKELRRQHK